MARNKLRDIFFPEEKWLDKSIIDADPCKNCPTYIDYKVIATVGSIADRQYARLPKTCPCVKRLVWEMECFAKLEWYERNDPTLQNQKKKEETE